MATHKHTFETIRTMWIDGRWVDVKFVIVIDSEMIDGKTFRAAVTNKDQKAVRAKGAMVIHAAQVFSEPA